MKHVLAPVLALSALCPGAALGWTWPVSKSDVGIRDLDPQLPHDPNTIAQCSWWYDNDGSLSCSDMLSLYGVEPAAFSYWNPSVSVSCGNFKTGQSYCVEGPKPPVATTTTTTATTATTVKPTTTAPGNGITTPTPIQEGMVNSCNKFFFVEKGTSCSAVLSANGLTIAQLYAMNPGIGSDCTGMWAQVYICVGTTGGSPTSTTKPTTTAPGNGIATPSPIQEGMVGNCDAFYFVKKGTSCSTVLSTNQITIAQLYKWNPGVGQDCTGMWAEVYVCVSTTDHTPPTTTQGNGVVTPTPTQTGMVGNCKTFYFVKSGDTCDSIATKYGVSVSNFKNWNKGVGSDCTLMWKDAYVCVGLI